MQSTKAAQTKRAIFLVHGFKFDPEAKGKDNPHNSLYVEWKKHLLDYPVYEFSYYSAPGVLGYYRAWKYGYRDAYSWAYNHLSVIAAERLANELRNTSNGPHNIISHSLGTRVALHAARLGAPINRCILLNGAELRTEAIEIAKLCPDTTFYNVYAKADAVIDFMAENFTPGVGGGSAIGNNSVEGFDNWINIVLDDGKIQAWGRNKGWNLKGDNPVQISDHWYSYRWKENWKLYQAILNGEDISDIPKV